MEDHDAIVGDKLVRRVQAFTPSIILFPSSRQLIIRDKFMAKVKSIQSLYFSPTGNTRKIIEAISKGIGLPVAKPIDFTLPRQRESWSGTVQSDLLIVGLPVYAGSFPSLILPFLKKLDGMGRWAVPVAVCGNVQMRTCLADLTGVLKKQGFMIPAAANFIGQHSFATEDLPLGSGRPDQRDLRKAVNFGKKIASKMQDNPTDITSIRGGMVWIRQYLTGSLEAQGSSFLERYSQIIRVSEQDRTHCENCQKCVESCPTGAIDAKTLQISDTACIRCFACTSACPSGTKQKVVEPDPELRAWFLKQGSVRAEPQILL